MEQYHGTTILGVKKGGKTACMSCHQHTNVHQKQYGDDKCLDCHKMAGVVETKPRAVNEFHGPNSRFPLTEGHRGVACAKCHPNNSFTHAPLQCGSLSCPHDSRAFTLGGTLLQLTPRESAALAVLLARSGTPVEKSQLSGKVFPADSNAGPDAIELVLHRLRRKLEGGDVRIVTVRGLGYMLESMAEHTAHEDTAH